MYTETSPSSCVRQHTQDVPAKWVLPSLLQNLRKIKEQFWIKFSFCSMQKKENKTRELKLRSEWVVVSQFRVPLRPCKPLRLPARPLEAAAYHSFGAGVQSFSLAFVECVKFPRKRKVLMRKICWSKANNYSVVYIHAFCTKIDSLRDLKILLFFWR